jgi:hypothetical protein
VRYILLFAVAFAVSSVSASAQVSGKSSTCGSVAGKTQADLDNVLKFCSAAVPKDLEVTGAFAMETLLWVKISRALANIMRNDRLSTEQVVKNWMKGWKGLTGKQAVTVTVEWQDVKIAEGTTTLLSGDKVTIP